jgi:hypothetical protein
MGDECTCEKCQAISANVRRADVWPVVRPEVMAEGAGFPPRRFYLVVTEGGISLSPQSSDM